MPPITLAGRAGSYCRCACARCAACGARSTAGSHATATGCRTCWDSAAGSAAPAAPARCPALVRSDEMTQPANTRSWLSAGCRRPPSPICWSRSAGHGSAACPGWTATISASKPRSGAALRRPRRDCNSMVAGAVRRHPAEPALWMLALTHFGKPLPQPAIWGWISPVCCSGRRRTCWSRCAPVSGAMSGSTCWRWRLMLPALLGCTGFDQLDQHVRSSPNLPEKSTP